MIGGRGGHHRRGGKRVGRFQLTATNEIAVKVRYILTADPHFEKLPPGKRVALVATDNTLCLANDDPEAFAERFVGELLDWTLRMRGERKMPKDVCIDRHVSFHANDPVDARQALTIARSMVERVMGPLDDRIGLFAVHADKSHVHVHFIVSVVDTSGRIFNPHHDDDLWMAATDALEVEHGLHRVTQRPRFSQRVDTASTHIKVPRKAQLQRSLRECRAGVGTNFPAFLSALDRRNIQIVGRFSDGESGPAMIGCSFHHDGEMFNGSQLSKSLAWTRIAPSIGYSTAYLPEMQLRTAAFHEQSQAQCILYRDDTLGNLFPSPRKWRRSIVSSKPIEPKNNDKIMGYVFHWRRNPKEAFREIAQGGGVGSGAAEQMQLQTTNGTSRGVIRLMLERAVELGWKGIVATGSREFMRLVHSIRESWIVRAAVKMPAEEAEPIIVVPQPEAIMEPAARPRLNAEPREDQSEVQDGAVLKQLSIRPFTVMAARVDEVFARFEITLPHSSEQIQPSPVSDEEESSKTIKRKRQLSPDTDFSPS